MGEKRKNPFLRDYVLLLEMPSSYFLSSAVWLHKTKGVPTW